LSDALLVLWQAQRQHAAGWAAVDQGKIRAQEAGRGVQQKAAELAQNVSSFMKSKKLSADALTVQEAWNAPQKSLNCTSEHN
jgi:hypothetical protein